jgi:phosphatidylinositol 3,5-bisphosphate 5-phosphatase
MGYTKIRSQALSAPPYLVAFFVVIIVAILSDRHKNRSYYVCAGAVLSGAGYLLMAITGALRLSAGWRYCGCYLAASGFFTCVTLIITWTINNQQTESKKGTSMSLLNVIGQFGPLLGTRLYPDSDGPYYVKGMTICAAFMFLVFFLSLGFRFILKRENARMEVVYMAVGEEGDEGAETSEKVVAKPFQYIL